MRHGKRTLLSMQHDINFKYFCTINSIQYQSQHTANMSTQNIATLVRAGSDLRHTDCSQFLVVSQLIHIGSMVYKGCTISTHIKILVWSIGCRLFANFTFYSSVCCVFGEIEGCEFCQNFELINILILSAPGQVLGEITSILFYNIGLQTDFFFQNIRCCATLQILHGGGFDFPVAQ